MFLVAVTEQAQISTEDLLRLTLVAQPLARGRKSLLADRLRNIGSNEDLEGAYVRSERVLALCSSLLGMTDQFDILEAIVELSSYCLEAEGIDLEIEDAPRFFAELIEKAQATLDQWRDPKNGPLMQCHYCVLHLPFTTPVAQCEHINAHHAAEHERYMISHGFQPDDRGGWFDTRA